MAEKSLTDQQPQRLVWTISPEGAGFFPKLKELWQAKELIELLVWRDLSVRYKQTFLGVVWAVIQPLMMMGVVSLLFRKSLQVPGMPSYPALVLVSFVVWQYVAGAVGRGGISLISNAQLLQKVYFPRPVVVIATVLAPLADLFVCLFVVLCILPFLGFMPAASWMIAILNVVPAALLALTVSFWLSALTIRYRDLQLVIPFLIQVWMFASPIFYSPAIVPENWRQLYYLNPLAGLIDFMHWSLLGHTPYWRGCLISLASCLVLFVAGFLHFSRAERALADIL